LYRGFLTSFVGHVLLLGWALFSIHRPPDLPDTVTIEATLITPSELTRLKQGSPDSQHLEAKVKEAEKPE
jgi:colicin import membrane protein